MNRVRDELVLFLSAAGFLTRLPMPGWVGWADDRMIRASRYFAAVGALVGLAGGLVWWLAGQVAPGAVAAGLALAAMIWLTGALHEDGLADCADGLGGGETGEQALEIMRDSRVGSYGALALVFSVGLRWVALAALAPGWGLLALVLALAATGGFLLYLVRRVGGYTGDGLGAIAQLGEIAVLVVLAGAWA